MANSNSENEKQMSNNKFDRRSFFKKAGLGTLGLGMFSLGFEDQFAHAAAGVNRFSAPSDLKITDLRIAQYGNVPIVKIYTNQGITGLGDVRDGADKRYALFLKSRILGENPCNVEKIFKRIKQFGHHGRQAGGVCGVETALWDLTGKAYGVPVYQLLGGKYRDKVRIYVDTPKINDPEQFAQKMKSRVDEGFTFLKQDLGVDLIDKIPGTLTNADVWRGDDGELHGWNQEMGTLGATKHPFTRIQITEKGLEELEKYPAATRDAIGYEIPLGTDHMGHIGVNSCIKIAQMFEKYNFAWLEDLVPWQYTGMWKEISQNTHSPTMTGEDIYLLDGFKDLIDNRAVDIVHPDPNSAGGVWETKKIGDYAQAHGIAMALHHAASPVSFLSSVHSAAATQNFIALEHHSVDNPWWEDLVTGVKKPIVEDGYVTVPEKPGIGVELNEDVVKEHLREGEEFFAPTEEWNEMRSWDRLWS